MPAHYDVRNLEGDYGILNDGGNAPHHLSIGWHNIANIAADKEVAWSRVRDQRWIDAAISAGNEEHLGILFVPELLEEFTMLWIDLFSKMPVTLNHFGYTAVFGHRNLLRG